LLYEISELMGLKQKLTHHRLRASFITNIQRNGCSLAIATKLARHSNPAITLAVYTEATMEDLRNGLLVGLGKIPPPQVQPQADPKEDPLG
jgi:site-specific recombinase XerD